MNQLRPRQDCPPILRIAPATLLPRPAARLDGGCILRPVKTNPAARHLFALSVLECASALHAAPRPTSDYDTTRAALAAKRADALERWEALHARMRHSGADALLIPSAAMAYERSGNPAQAYALLESLRNQLARPHGFLSHPANRHALAAALRAAAFADPDCRAILPQLTRAAGDA